MHYVQRVGANVLTHTHVLPGLSSTEQSPESKLPSVGTGARNSTKLQRRDNVARWFGITESCSGVEWTGGLVWLVRCMVASYLNTRHRKHSSSHSELFRLYPSPSPHTSCMYTHTDCISEDPDTTQFTTWYYMVLPCSISRVQSLHYIIMTSQIFIKGAINLLYPAFFVLLEL